MLANDVFAALQQLVATNPALLFLGLILSGWFVFSKASKAILSDLAALDIALINHRKRRRKALVERSRPSRPRSRALPRQKVNIRTCTASLNPNADSSIKSGELRS